METISRLRTALINLVGTRGRQDDVQELFDELVVHKKQLLNLFDVGSRSQTEQREVESGMLHIVYRDFKCTDLSL